MTSASRAALVVATSMASVEALKDQLGLCRWNYAIRNLSLQAKAVAIPSSQQRQAPSSFGAAGAAGKGKSSPKVSSSDEKLQRRRAEKAEMVMHLVCWGPN